MSLIRRLLRRPVPILGATTPPRPSEAGWTIPDEHAAIEHAQIARHRSAVGVDPKTIPTEIPGLAISGGGIRSAVFSLGVIQLLADQNKLREFSYISTVSGGSYLGAFYGSLFIPDEMRQGAPDLPEQVFAEAARTASMRVRPKTLAKKRVAVTSIEYLRNNCNYLVPNGLDDVLQSIVFAGRNWFALQYVIGASVLTIMLWLNWVEMLPLVQTWLQTWLPQKISLRSLISGCTLELNSMGWVVPGALGLAIMVLVLSPLNRAYWLTQNLAQDLRLTFKTLPIVSLILVGIMAVGTIEVIRLEVSDTGWNDARWLVIGWALAIILSQLISIIYLRLAWIYTKRDKQTGKRWFHGVSSQTLRGSDSRPFVDRVRNALTNAYTTPLTFRTRSVLTGPTQLVILLLTIALVDFGGSYVEAYLASSSADQFSAVLKLFLTAIFASGGLWTLGRFLLAKGDAIEKAYKRIPKIVLASVAAVIASLATLLIWSTLAHIIVARILKYADNVPFLPHGSWLDAKFIILTAVCFVMLLITVLDGLCIQFLNLSTYQRLYSSRLTRTFLGASNRTRLEEPDQRDVTSLVSGDSISMGQYYNHNSCAPVHLINATINKTVDWNSSLVHRGARGLSMCIGPAGISVGARLGALLCDWQAANDISTPATHNRDNVKTFGIWLESLTLGDWIAISGAAVSTGLGRMTRAGYSLLLGIANIRLGYWWDTYSAPFRDGPKDFKRTRVPLPTKDIRRRSLSEDLFGTQFCLLNELFGRFDGPRARRWYLTDGGHFENTGAYELLRRGLKFIVLLDNGADRDFIFEDVAALMRLARVDFGIEIYTSDAPPQQPERLYVDFDYVALSFHEFTQRKKFLAIRMLTQFPDGTKGQIILIKPRLTTLAPYDVWEYAKKRSDFPQETTANQFFDDVQWECHRALGESQARSLFVRKS